MKRRNRSLVYRVPSSALLQIPFSLSVAVVLDGKSSGKYTQITGYEEWDSIKVDCHLFCVCLVNAIVMIIRLSLLLLLLLMLVLLLS